MVNQLVGEVEFLRRNGYYSSRKRHCEQDDEGGGRRAHGLNHFAYATALDAYIATCRYASRNPTSLECIAPSHRGDLSGYELSLSGYERLTASLAHYSLLNAA